MNIGLSHKYNNFDFLRFLFAVFVVISHSYALSGDNEVGEGVNWLSKGQMSFSSIGLSGFFVISGFFIFQSLQRSENLLDYLKNRFLRLFPALFVVLLVSLLLSPLVYNGDTPFLENLQVYTYLPNNLSLYLFQSGIKGIFDANPYHSINGSLWTIRYEFSLYLALVLLFYIKGNKVITQTLLGLALTILLITYNFFLERFAGSSILGMQGYHILNLGTFFVCGSFLASIEFKKYNSKWILYVSMILLLVSIYYHFYSEVKHILLTIIVMSVGFMPLPFFSDFGRIGDMSYGIYIYSFPIQQTLVYFFKLHTYDLMLYSVFISIGFGYLSWDLIEKKALSFKKKIIHKH